MKQLPWPAALTIAAIVLVACAPATNPGAAGPFYGTLEPFASEAIYFVMTDRFVNGDQVLQLDGQDLFGPTSFFGQPIVRKHVSPDFVLSQILK